MRWNRGLWIGKWVGEDYIEHRVCFRASGSMENAKETLELIAPENFIECVVFKRCRGVTVKELEEQGYKFEDGE